MGAIIPDRDNGGVPGGPGGESTMVTAARPLPATGEVFLDARGGNRALRVSWHQEAELVVLSLWRDDVCAGSFRLAVDEVPRLIDLLRAGLDEAYDVARRRRHA
jgi:hypothetical protein